MTALVGCRVGAAGVIGWESEVVGFGGTSEGLLEDSFILGVVVEAAGHRRYGWRYIVMGLVIFISVYWQCAGLRKVRVK
jgi:hypothetical protein